MNPKASKTAVLYGGMPLPPQGGQGQHALGGKEGPLASECENENECENVSVRMCVSVKMCEGVCKRGCV